MPRVKSLILLAAIFAVTACSDAVGPLEELGEPPVLGAAAGKPIPETELHVLRHAPWAPQLETYELSFWLVKGKAKTVEVRYLEGDAGSVAHPFLRFRVPARALRAARDRRLRRGDSVLVTVTIDPVLFKVEFAPSGLQFSRRRPAQLDLWYGQADPDLNGDGQVDELDEEIRVSQLGMSLQSGQSRRWRRLTTEHDLPARRLSTWLFHFSGVVISL